MYDIIKDMQKTDKQKLYQVWTGMKQRCQNENYEGFHNYGGRGISVCNSWQVFESFYDWASVNAYSQGLWLDRLDNDKNYEPSNCRWVTPKSSSRNKRESIFVTAFGETKHLLDWLNDERCVAAYGVIRRRIKNGIDPEEALTKRRLRGGARLGAGRKLGSIELDRKGLLAFRLSSQHQQYIDSWWSSEVEGDTRTAGLERILDRAKKMWPKGE